MLLKKPEGYAACGHGGPVHPFLDRLAPEYDLAPPRIIRRRTATDDWTRTSWKRPTASGSWKMEDLRTVLKGQGFDLCAGTIRKVIRSTGFRWRKARTVLTSNDPHYREKVD